MDCGEFDLADLDSHSEAAVVPFSGRSFDSSYRDFSKMLKSSTAKKQEFTSDDHEEPTLATSEQTLVSDAIIANMVQEVGCSGFQSSFQVHVDRAVTEDMPSVRHVRWKPPLKEIAQARYCDQKIETGAMT